MFSAPKHTVKWREIQRKNFTKKHDLIQFLELEPKHLEAIIEMPHFPLNMPYRLAQKVTKNTLEDPILKQFLPLSEELIQKEGFLCDPVGDGPSRKCAKLLHKYQKRALLITTSACAMHCRYCFRRNFPYENQDKTFLEELSLIKEDISIEEIILSGGDPLSLSDEVLGGLIKNLEEIPHIKKIRFHSRFPIGIPERIDETFLNTLESCSKQIIFVIHCNHPKELDSDVLHALKKIQKLGIPVLNQAVFLKGINDDFETLKELLSTLTDHGILPYYLHQLDKAEGASHFEVPKEKGLSLLQELAACLPGYAIPKYVQEIAGKSSKTPILP